MKCAQCGEELKEGSLFCSKCGKEVQIVPDYNEYEEDYLKQVLAEANRPKRPKRSQEQKNSQELTEQRKKRMVLYIILAAVVLLTAILIGCLTAWSSMKKKQESSFDYQVEMARKAYQEGDLDMAISYYENALSLDTDNIEVRLILAEIYMDRGDYNSALILCQEIMKRDRANQSACEILIQIYENQKNYDAVLALYEAADESLHGLFAAYLVSAPEFRPEAGTYDEFMEVELTSGEGFEIYYSLDGSDPAQHGQRYTEPIELLENLKTYTITAVCMNDKGIYSDAASREYRIDIPAPDLPIVTPDGGDFGVETPIYITVPDGCSAYYTWDGSDPNVNSTRYTGPIYTPEGNNVLSVIIIDNTTDLCSDIYRGNFIYYPEDDEGEELPDASSEDAGDSGEGSGSLGEDSSEASNEEHPGASDKEHPDAPGEEPGSSDGEMVTIHDPQAGHKND